MAQRLAHLALVVLLAPAWLLPGPVAVCVGDCACPSAWVGVRGTWERGGDVESEAAAPSSPCSCCASTEPDGTQGEDRPDHRAPSDPCPCCLLLSGGLEPAPPLTASPTDVPLPALGLPLARGPWPLAADALARALRPRHPGERPPDPPPSHPRPLLI